MTDKTPSPAPETETEAAGTPEPASRPGAQAEAGGEARTRAQAEARNEGAEAGSEPVPESADAADAAAPAGSRAGGPPAEIPVSAAVHKRLTTGLGGFTLAIAACLLIVAAIWAITPRGTKEVLPTVDYGSQLWAMSKDAPYTVHAPQGLAPGWRPTSSRLHGLEGGGQPVAWHLGFVTPADEYAALEQSNEPAAKYVPRMTNSKNAIGTQQIAGATWTKYYRKDKKASSLARTLPDGVSLVVTGTASFEELAVLAGSLRPQPKQNASLAPSPAATQRS